jgi:hypothetical protein
LDEAATRQGWLRIDVTAMGVVAAGSVIASPPRSHRCARAILRGRAA